MEQGIKTFLSNASIRLEDVDLVLLGKSGDVRYDTIVNAIEHKLFRDADTGVYKHLCGEYPVASAFALWLAVNIVHNQQFPEVVMTKKTSRPHRNVLIYNQYFNTHHSLILVTSC